MAKPWQRAPWVGVNFWSRTRRPTDVGALRRRGRPRRAGRPGGQWLQCHSVLLLLARFRPASPNGSTTRYWSGSATSSTPMERRACGTIPTFIVGHMSGENWDPAWRQGRDLYRDVWMVSQQAWFAAELARRFGSHPAVAGWLVSNEMPIYGGPGTIEEVTSWARLVVQAIRSAGVDTAGFDRRRRLGHRSIRQRQWVLFTGAGSARGLSRPTRLRQLGRPRPPIDGRSGSLRALRRVWRPCCARGVRAQFGFCL